MRERGKIQQWGCFDNVLLPVGVPVPGSLAQTSGCRKAAGEKTIKNKIIKKKPPHSREKRRPARNNNSEKNVTLNCERSTSSCLHLEGLSADDGQAGVPRPARIPAARAGPGSLEHSRARGPASPAAPQQGKHTRGCHSPSPAAPQEGKHARGCHGPSPTQHREMGLLRHPRAPQQSRSSSAAPADAQEGAAGQAVAGQVGTVPCLLQGPRLPSLLTRIWDISLQEKEP